MKVSIITINYNDRIGLERTIKSVVTQTYTEIEYIVIDGGSSDGSKEVIEAYSDKIAYWISEKDKGVYNAMNKGILKATGDYLFFLNSGDKFSDDKVLSSFWSAPSDKKFVYGNVNYVHENHIDLITYPSILTFKFWVQGTICHQAVFMHKSCFDVAGLYDEDLKIVSDWKLLIIGYVWHKFTYEYRPVTISDFYADGISSNPESMGLLIKEQQQVLNEYFHMFAKDYADLINLENKARYFNPKILLQKGPHAILRKLKAFIK